MVDTRVPEIKSVSAPEGIEGAGFFATSLEKVVGIARANSLWPLPFATSCCGIEFMATMGAHYDISRFGSERPSFSPRQADLLILSGRISIKMAPIVRRIWDQMLEPKWSIAMGACSSSMGVFNNYAIVPADKFMPVAVHVPGCPPRPEALMEGIMRLQDKISARTIGLPRGSRAVSDDRPLIATAPAAV